MELGIGLELRLQGSRGVDCDGVSDGGATWGQGELAQGQRADFGGTERSRGGGFRLLSEGISWLSGETECL